MGLVPNKPYQGNHKAALYGSFEVSIRSTGISSFLEDEKSTGGFRLGVRGGLRVSVSGAEDTSLTMKPLLPTSVPSGSERITNDYGGPYSL